MPKDHLWSKAKSTVGAPNMGAPVQRKARKAPAGMSGFGGTKKLKAGKR